jgi:hypothetical protein
MLPLTTIATLALLAFALAPSAAEAGAATPADDARALDDVAAAAVRKAQARVAEPKGERRGRRP